VLLGTCTAVCWPLVIPWISKCIHLELAPVAAAVAVAHAYGDPSVEGCSPNICDISECFCAMGLLKTYFVFRCASQGRQRLPVAEAAAAAPATGGGGAEGERRSSAQPGPAAAEVAAAAAVPELFQSHQFTMPDTQGVILPGESKTFRCVGGEGGSTAEICADCGGSTGNGDGGGGRPADTGHAGLGVSFRGTVTMGTCSRGQDVTPTLQVTSAFLPLKAAAMMCLKKAGAAFGGLLPCHDGDRDVTCLVT
jgi:hypothetical protein